MAERPSNVRYIVLFGLCLAAALAYVHRGSVGVAESTIRGDLHLTVDQTGRFTTIFFLCYALCQIPTGLLVDRWGARKSLLLFGMLGAFTQALGAGTLIVGTTVGFFVLLTSRALMGVAQAGLFPASTRCIATWFPLRRRAFATGILQASMSIGGAVGATVTGRLLRVTAWPWVFLLLAIPGVIWSLWFFRWYRDRPEEHGSINETEKELLRPPVSATPSMRTAGSTPWLALAMSPQMIWLCASQFFRASAIVFWLAWSPTFLQNVYGVTVEESGELTSIPFIGVVLGSLGGGILSDRVLAKTGSKRWGRNGVAIGTSAIGIGIFVLAFFVHAGPHVAIGLLFVAAFFTAGANPCSYSVSIDIGGRHMAVVFAAMNMFGNFGSAMFPLLVPPWTRAFGWPALPLLMASLYFLGMICWIFVNPNGTVLEKTVHPVIDE